MFDNILFLFITFIGIVALLMTLLVATSEDVPQNWNSNLSYFYIAAVFSLVLLIIGPRYFAVYTYLRILISCYAVYAAYNFIKNKFMFWAIIYILLSIYIFPEVTHNSRLVWKVIDVLYIGSVSAGYFYFKRYLRARSNQ